MDGGGNPWSLNWKNCWTGILGSIDLFESSSTILIFNYINLVEGLFLLPTSFTCKNLPWPKQFLQFSTLNKLTKTLCGAVERPVSHGHKPFVSIQRLILQKFVPTRMRWLVIKHIKNRVRINPFATTGPETFTHLNFNRSFLRLYFLPLRLERLFFPFAFVLLTEFILLPVKRLTVTNKFNKKYKGGKQSFQTD